MLNLITWILIPWRVMEYIYFTSSGKVNTPPAPQEKGSHWSNSLHFSLIQFKTWAGMLGFWLRREQILHWPWRPGSSRGLGPPSFVWASDPSLKRAVQKLWTGIPHGRGVRNYTPPLRPRSASSGPLLLGSFPTQAHQFFQENSTGNFPVWFQRQLLVGTPIFPVLLPMV